MLDVVAGHGTSDDVPKLWSFVDSLFRQIFAYAQRERGLPPGTDFLIAEKLNVEVVGEGDTLFMQGR